MLRSTSADCNDPLASLLITAAVALDTAGDTALVSGGLVVVGVQSTCYSYVAATDVWSDAAPLTTARYMHGMSVYKGTHSLPYSV